MKRTIILCFVILFLLAQCKKNNTENEEVRYHDKNISGTTWHEFVAENCNNSITFFATDSIVLFSCEIGEKNYGTYKISNDTLICNMTKGEFDYEFSENSRHRLKPYNFKMVYSDSILTELNDQKTKYIRK